MPRAAKRPDNNNAIIIHKRPGNAWPSCRRNVHAGLSKFYFAAVGSGAGFSDSEFK
jgi:hypothetical protein